MGGGGGGCMHVGRNCLSGDNTDSVDDDELMLNVLRCQLTY